LSPSAACSLKIL
nr:immunoglobulin light chain junction region [Homo sapiens]